jgi:cytochrome c oxidase assembly protein subunit 15
MSRPGPPNHAVASWLFLCAGLVFALAVLGGVTRLTGAGLSMVRWEPLRGTVPPLDEAAWQEELDAYRESPEFRIRTPELDLAGFRRIYWVEFAHRLLARLVGLVFLLPLVGFLLAGRVGGRDAARFGGILALGALQAVVGWLMVASGLVDRPHVSPYRLALHLVLGAALLAALLWQGLRWLEAPSGRRRGGLAAASRVLGATIGLALVGGALMAGTGAGHAYRTFPLIGGRLIPPGLGALDPWWRNPLENPVAIHVLHRSTALAVLLLTGWMAWRAVRGGTGPSVRAPLAMLVTVVVVQIALGVRTLLLGSPPLYASLHQATGLALLGAWVLFHHRLAWQPDPEPRHPGGRIR